MLLPPELWEVIADVLEARELSHVCSWLWALLRHRHLVCRRCTALNVQAKMGWLMEAARAGHIHTLTVRMDHPLRCVTGTAHLRRVLLDHLPRLVGSAHGTSLRRLTLEGAEPGSGVVWGSKTRQLLRVKKNETTGCGGV